MTSTDLFIGRQLIIATRHGKEKLIGPVLQAELGVEIVHLENLDTDQFGTFTGEVERELDPLTTARKKCEIAMNESRLDLAVASEGSFGAHPVIPFVPANEELLLMVDRKNKLEIWVKEISAETNFAGKQIKDLTELEKFCEQTRFPSHALIIRTAANDNRHIVKAICDENFLIETFRFFIQTYGVAYVETDMRSMYNPMRQKVIAKAAWKLSEKMKSVCPACQRPGFGVTEVRAGLPCNHCGSKTKSTLSHQYKCDHCGYLTEKFFPHGRLSEDPMFCDQCNP
ncbi:MAG: DUF6671 family protein [Chitinophagaceae bacterium]